MPMYLQCTSPENNTVLDLIHVLPFGKHLVELISCDFGFFDRQRLHVGMWADRQKM